MTDPQVRFVMRVCDAAPPDMEGMVSEAIFRASLRGDELEVARIAKYLIAEMRREDLAADWTEHFGAMFS